MGFFLCRGRAFGGCECDEACAEEGGDEGVSEDADLRLSRGMPP
jgi:hypothetical protein